MSEASTRSDMSFFIVKKSVLSIFQSNRQRPGQELNLQATQSNDILVLEDEPLIALDLEDMLHHAGFKTNVLMSCAEALEWLQAKTPQVAVLDMHLKDGTCIDVAAVLNARGVPLIICSGSSERHPHEAFQTSTWLSKPTAERDLLTAVREAVTLR